jgi:outer membrane protein assembly factor BamB
MVILTNLAACDRPGKQGSDSIEDPEFLWKYEGLGRGFGGPCISREGIFVNAEEDGDSYTVCLEPDGAFRWKSPNGKEFVGMDFSASYPGTRSAPTVSGERVYAASGMGHLSCFNIRDGIVIWSVDLMNDLNGRLGEFGYSESPVVDRDKVYCFPGGEEDNLVALDRQTGDVVWSGPLKNDFFAYDTPVLLNLSGKEVLVGSSRNYIHVVKRQDGSLLSSYKFEDIKYGHEHCNSVVYRDGFIYYIGCEGGGAGAFKLQLSEDGESLTEVWRNPGVLNVFGGFIVKDNVLYTTLETKKLVGLDIETGQILHSVRAESGSIVHADKILFIYGHNGKLQLFSLNDGEPELKSEMRIRDGSGHHFSFPVIVDGVMYLRRGDALMAYAVK